MTSRPFGVFMFSE